MSNKNSRNTGNNASFEKINGESFVDYRKRVEAESLKTGYASHTRNVLSAMSSKYEEVSGDVDKLQSSLRYFPPGSPEYQSVRDNLMNLTASQIQRTERINEYSAKVNYNNHQAYESSVLASQRRIRSHFSDREVASRAQQYRSATSSYQPMREISHTMTTEQLESSIAEQEATIHGRSKRLHDIIGHTDPKSIRQAQGLQGIISQAEEKRALYAGALQHQRRDRRDFTSMRQEAEGQAHSYGKALNQIESTDSTAIQARMAQFKGQSKDEALESLTEQWKQSLKAAKEAADEFANATTDSSGRIQKKSEEASQGEQQARQKLKDAEKYFDQEEERKSARARNAMMALAGVSMTANAAGRMMDFAYVQHPAQIQDAKVHAAGIFSRQYSDMEGMASGDVRASRRLLESYGAAGQEGAVGFDKSAYAAILRMTGQVAGAGAAIGGVVAGTTGGRFGGAIGRGLAMGTRAIPGLGKIALATYGVGLAAQHGGAFMEEAAHYKADLTQAEAFMTRYNSAMGLSDAEREIQERRTQQSMNNMMGLQDQLVGFGGARASLYDSNAVNTMNMRNIGDSGLTLSRRNEMLSVGRQTLGGDMSQADMMMANSAYMNGHVNSAEAMTALGDLRSVGGTTENFASVLKEAVTAGLNDSKSIMAMVGGITNLSKDLAVTRGISTVDSAQTMMGSLMQSTMDSGLPMGLRTEMALNAAQYISGTTTSGEFNLENIIELAEIKETLGAAGVNASTRELHAIQTMDIKDINALSMMEESDAKDMLKNMGLSRLTSVSGDDFTKMISGLREASYKQLAFGTMKYSQQDATTVNNIKDYLKTGGKLIGADEEVLSTYNLKQTDLDQFVLAANAKKLHAETLGGGFRTGMDASGANINPFARFEAAQTLMNAEQPHMINLGREQMKALEKELGPEQLEHFRAQQTKSRQEQEGITGGREDAKGMNAVMNEVSQNFDKMSTTMMKAQESVAASLANLPDAATKLNSASTNMNEAAGKISGAATVLEGVANKISNGSSLSLFGITQLDDNVKN